MFVGAYPEFSEARWQETVQQYPEYHELAAILDQAGAEPVPRDSAQSSAIVDGALRYFDSVDPTFLGDRIAAPAMLYSGQGDDFRKWDGFLITKDGMIGFFEKSDWLVENPSDGDPAIHQLSELLACTVRMPHSLHSSTNLTHISVQEPASIFLARLAFGDSVMQLSILVEDIPESLRHEFKSTVDAIRTLLEILEKALALNDNGKTSKFEMSRSGLSAEPKPTVQIPEVDELISLPEFQGVCKVFCEWAAS